MTKSNTYRFCVPMVVALLILTLLGAAAYTEPGLGRDPRKDFMPGMLSDAGEASFFSASMAGPIFGDVADVSRDLESALFWTPNQYTDSTIRLSLHSAAPEAYVPARFLFALPHNPANYGMEP